MIDFSSARNVYLYSKEVDMRMGMNTAQKLLYLSFSPVEILNSMFIFVSKSRKCVKIYYEDMRGTWLMINKVKYFKFQVERLQNNIMLTREDVDCLLSGVEIQSQRNKEIGV